LSKDRFSKSLSHCPAAERPHWLRRELACYFQIAGGALSLPLGPLRSPDQKDILFENRSKPSVECFLSLTFNPDSEVKEGIVWR
jgi:hypothetical protein